MAEGIGELMTEEMGRLVDGGMCVLMVAVTGVSKAEGMVE